MHDISLRKLERCWGRKNKRKEYLKMLFVKARREAAEQAVKVNQLEEAHLRHAASPLVAN